MLLAETGKRWPKWQARKRRAGSAALRQLSAGRSRRTLRSTRRKHRLVDSTLFAPPARAGPSGASAVRTHGRPGPVATLRGPGRGLPLRRPGTGALRCRRPVCLPGRAQPGGVRSERVRRPGRRWEYCASEGGICNFTGPGEVRYGINGKFVVRRAIYGMPCSVSAFREDPAYGENKLCFAHVGPR